MTAVVRLCLGLAAWAAVFSLLYALHGVGCAAGWAGIPIAGTSLHRLVLLVAWIGGTAATALLAIALARQRGTEGGAPVARSARILAWVAVAAVAVGGLPILIVPACL